MPEHQDSLAERSPPVTAFLCTGNGGSSLCPGKAAAAVLLDGGGGVVVVVEVETAAVVPQMLPWLTCGARLNSPGPLQFSWRDFALAPPRPPPPPVPPVPRTSRLSTCPNSRL